MRGLVGGIKGLNWFFNICVALLLVLAVQPVLAGTFQVVLPQTNEWSGSIDEHKIDFTSYVRIRNTGVYGINGLHFDAALYLDNGSELVTFHSDTINITNNLWYLMELDFRFNVTLVTNQLLEDLLFYGANLKAVANVHAKYMMGMVDATASYSAKMSIGPLIRNFDCDYDNSTMSEDVQNYTLHIPYSFSSSGMLNSTHIDYSQTISNRTSTLAVLSTSLTIEENATGMLNLTVSKAAGEHLKNESDVLTIRTVLRVGDAELVIIEEIQWSPTEDPP